MKGGKDALLRRKKKTWSARPAHRVPKKYAARGLRQAHLNIPRWEFSHDFLPRPIFFLGVYRLSLQGRRAKRRPRQPWVTTISRIELAERRRKTQRAQKKSGFFASFQCGRAALGRERVCAQWIRHIKNERIKNEEYLIYARHVRQSDAPCMELEVERVDGSDPRAGYLCIPRLCASLVSSSVCLSICIFDRVLLSRVRPGVSIIFHFFPTEKKVPSNWKNTQIIQINS